jgi:poly(hydroxyalkanoate) depolymerase family esterase
MPRSFAATLRRTTRMMRPRAPTKALRKVQKAVALCMVNAAYAPFTPLKPTPARGRKPKRVARALTGAKRHMPAPALVQDAQYLALRHRSVSGSRGYKLYLPANQPKQLNGLIVMLHGCKQTADDFAAGTNMNALAEKHGLVIAYPEQTKRYNAAQCWNWFKLANQTRGAGEPAILAALTRKLMREFNLDRDHTFVAGLSAGGAMAAILADTYPDIYAGAGVHSGLARGSARNVISAMSAMRRGGKSNRRDPAARTSANPAHKPVRRIIFHGDSDRTVHPANAATIVTAAIGATPMPAKTSTSSVRGRDYERTNFAATATHGPLELWMLTGGAHAWSGGRKAGSYTDSTGPNASAQMVRFFLG